MYISEQLLDPSADRLRLAAQLGVEPVVLDNRGTDLVSAPGGVTAWDAKRLADDRRWVEGFGFAVDVFALDVGSMPQVQRPDGGHHAHRAEARSRRLLELGFLLCGVLARKPRR